MKIFLVEDNEELNSFITDTFEKLGFSIVSSNDGAEAFSMCDDYFDLYLIDINLPNLNGLELVKKIKSKKDDSKIFIISGDDNIDTIIKAYDLGCSDYIKKPFDLREIIAKINITFKDKLNNQIKITDDCYFDKMSKLIYHKQKAITLTKKESQLLQILVENIGKIVQKDKIEKAVWSENTGNGHVRQLVSKLKKTLPCENIIQNHSSNGYGILTEGL